MDRRNFLQATIAIVASGASISAPITAFAANDKYDIAFKEAQRLVRIYTEFKNTPEIVSQVTADTDLLIRYLLENFTNDDTHDNNELMEIMINGDTTLSPSIRVSPGAFPLMIVRALVRNDIRIDHQTPTFIAFTKRYFARI